jgi:hypothetical protein
MNNFCVNLHFVLSLFEEFIAEDWRHIFMSSGLPLGRV